MNMLSAMPPAEKPAETGHKSGKANEIKKNQSGNNTELFSEMLLMLSAYGTNMAMPQSDGPVTLYSGINNAGGLRMAQLSKLDAVNVGRQLKAQKESEEDGVVTDITEGFLHSFGTEITLPGTVASDEYNGYPDMEPSIDDFRKHVEQSCDMTAEVTPEMIFDLAWQPVNSNSNEVSSANLITNHPDIVSQLSDRLIDLYHIGGHSAKIRLQPEELGNLHVDLSVVDDSIKAIITVEDNRVKDIIESDIYMLVEKLKTAGLNIDQFTVNIAGGWSDTNEGEMYNDDVISRLPVYEDNVISDRDEMMLYAGPANVISIFV